jgi:hypothetical protein
LGRHFWSHLITGAVHLLDFLKNLKRSCDAFPASWVHFTRLTQDRRQLTSVYVFAVLHIYWVAPARTRGLEDSTSLRLSILADAIAS